MNTKAVVTPVKKSTPTPIPQLSPTVGLTSVRPFADEQLALKEDDSTSEQKLAGAAAPPPPEVQRNQNLNSGYNFGQISISEYIPATPQAKLVVGAPGDKYEKEADAMADKVVQQRQEEDGTVHLKPLAQTIQRYEQEATLHLKRLSGILQQKEIEGVVHLKSIDNHIPSGMSQTLKQSTLISRQGNGGFAASENIETRVKSSKGGGNPLPDETRGFMEDRFGNDFSGVKVHTGSDAVQLSKDLGAQAFTHEQDVYFNSGKYSPHTDEGKKLLAHELTHTIQQTGPKERKKNVEKEKEEAKKELTGEKIDKDDKGAELKKYLAAESLKKVETQTAKVKEDTDTVKNKVKSGETGENLGKLEKETGEKIESQAKQESQEAEVKVKDKADEKGKQDASGQSPSKETVALPLQVKPGAGENSQPEQTDQPEAVPPIPEGEAKTADTSPIAVPEVSGDQAPATPEADPAFQAVIKQSKQQADQQSSHQSPKSAAEEAQTAAVDPDQQMREAQAGKMDDLNAKKPKPFDRKVFEDSLLEKLNLVKPKNADQADNFASSGKTDDIKNALNTEVKGAKKESGGGLPEESKAPPEPDAEAPKKVEELKPTQEVVGAVPPEIEAEKAVPKEKTEQEIEAPLAKTTENLEGAFGEIQAKSIVGSSSDPDEVQADQVAEQVMATPLTPPNPPLAMGGMGVESSATSLQLEPELTPPNPPLAMGGITDTEPNSPLAMGGMTDAEPNSPFAKGGWGGQKRGETIQLLPEVLIQRQEEVKPQSVAQPDSEVPLNVDRLETWKDEGGGQALDALKEAKTHGTTEGPQKFRQEEQETLTTAKTDAQASAKQTKVQRQVDSVVTQGELPLPPVYGGLVMVQRSGESAWKDKKNELVVKQKIKGNKKKASLTLTAKLMDKKKILPKVAKKLKSIIKKKPKAKLVKSQLPALKSQYKLKTLSLNILKPDGSKYVITGVAPDDDKSTKAQRQAMSPNTDQMLDAHSGVETAIQRSLGQGQPLPTPVREPMENAFGFDFAQVRIHHDTEGDRLSRSLNARAFTTGSDVFFRQGNYEPESPSGKRLLAHELTHVVQQSSESPLLSRTVQRVSEEVPYFVQREAEDSSESSDTNENPTKSDENLTKSDENSQNSALANAGLLIAGSMLVSGLSQGFGDGGKQKEQANITQSIQGNKLTMRVMITKQQDQDEQKNQRKKKDSSVANNLALPDDIVDDIVALIQQIVNQYPDPDIVQKKLDKLSVDFDLDLLKVVGSATIGNSITYDIQVKGRPQEPTDENNAAIAKNLDNLTPKEPETRPRSGSLLGGLLSQVSKSKKDSKTKDGKTKEDQPEKTPKAQEEKQKTNPEKTKKEAEDDAKSNQAQEELADEKETAKSQSKQGNKPGKNPLDVNTKVKRIDPATVEISVRADPKKK
ncbi:DUF4157 domain-containing protein [Planktothrix agardhii 1033]|nr:DUF4157 domain-containing protein [Planktothrix agardhii 1033]